MSITCSSPQLDCESPSATIHYNARVSCRTAVIRCRLRVATHNKPQSSVQVESSRTVILGIVSRHSQPTRRTINTINALPRSVHRLRMTAHNRHEDDEYRLRTTSLYQRLRASAYHNRKNRLQIARTSYGIVLIAGYVGRRQKKHQSSPHALRVATHNRECWRLESTMKRRLSAVGCKSPLTINDVSIQIDS